MDEASVERLQRLLAERAWLTRLARGLVRDAGAAEDLAQETWLAAWQKGPRLAYSWRAWLAGTARRLAASGRRGDGRRARRERAVARAEALPSSAELVAKSELLERVAREVLALDEPGRSTLLYTFQEGLTPREIAAREGLAEDTVRYRQRRALAELRARLERRLGDDWRAQLVFALPFSPGAASGVPLPRAAGTGATGTGSSVAAAFEGVVMGKVLLSLGLVVLLAILGVREQRQRRAEMVPARGELGTEGGARSQLLFSSSEAEPAVRAERTPALEEHSSASLEPCVVLGRVVDERGAPLAEVALQAWNSSARGDASRSALDGSFRIEHARFPEPLSVELTPDSYHAAAVLRFGAGAGQPPPLVPGTQDLGDLVLGDTGAVAGRVLGAEGLVPAKVWMMVGTLDGEAYPGDGAQVWCDSTGAFVVGHVRAGEWTLLAQSPGFREARAPIEVLAGRTSVQDLVLTPGPLVAGHVVDEHGNPLAGVRVSPDGFYYGWGAETDPEGAFEVPLASDEPCLLHAESATHEVVSGTSIAYAPGTRGIEIVMRAGESMTFRVVEEEGGAPIELFGLDVQHADRHTFGRPAFVWHADGEWTGEAREGEELRVLAPGHRLRVLPVQPDEPGTRLQTIRLARGSGLEGRIVRDGEPVGGVEVRLAEASERRVREVGSRRKLLGKRSAMVAPDVVALDREPPVYRERLEELAATRTDADGRFFFEGLEESATLLEARGRDGQRLRHGPVFLGAEQHLDLGNLSFPAPVRLSGRLRLAVPGPLAGHRLWLDGLGDEVATTDDEGRFTFESVAPGERWLSVEPTPELVLFPVVFFVRLAEGAEREVELALDNVPACRLTLELYRNGVPEPRFDAFSFVYTDGSGDRIGGRGDFLQSPDEAGRWTSVLPAGGEVLVEAKLDGLWLHDPRARLQLVPGEVVARIDYSSAALELEFPAGWSAEEGTRVLVRMRTAGSDAVTNDARYVLHGGVLLDADRRPMGSLLDGTLRIESAPVGELQVELLQTDGNTEWPLGQGSIRVQAGETVRLALH